MSVSRSGELFPPVRNARQAAERAPAGNIDDCTCRGCSLGKSCYSVVDDHAEASQSADPCRRFAAAAVTMAGDVLDGSAAGWYRLDERGEPAGMVGYQRHDNIVPLAEAHLRYVREVAGVDPFRVPPSSVGTIPDVLTTGELWVRAEFPVFVRYLVSIGVPHRAVLNLQLGGRMIAQVWIGRSDIGHEFDRADRRVLQSIHRFLQSAMAESFSFQQRVSFSPAGIEGLTERESEVASRAALGSTNQEIARDLYISPATVKTHLHRVFRKLEVRTRVELAHRLRFGAAPRSVL